MSDRNHDGDSIVIPSFMISIDDGVALNAAVTAATTTNSRVMATMAWDVPLNDKPEWSVWTNADAAVTTAFRAEFRPYLPYLGPSARFTPHYYIWDGDFLGCTKPENDCGTQCINGNLYCSMDNDQNGVTGNAVLLETVRQLCVWNQAVSTWDSDWGVRWWNYVDAFNANCGGSANSWNVDCSERVMGSVGIDVNGVRACAIDANSTGSGSNINELLQVEMDTAAEMWIVNLPTAVVQDVILRGGTQPQGVLAAICGAYTLGTAPAVCACSSVPPSGLEACMAGPASPSTPSWVGWIIALFVLGSAATLGGFYWFRKQTKVEVEGMMEDYKALVETGEAENAEFGRGGLVTGVAPGGGLGAPQSAAGKVMASLSNLAASLTAPPKATAPTFSSAGGGGGGVL